MKREKREEKRLEGEEEKQKEGCEKQLGVRFEYHSAPDDTTQNLPSFLQTFGTFSPGSHLEIPFSLSLSLSLSLSSLSLFPQKKR